MARHRKRRASSKTTSEVDEKVEWYFMRPCVGMVGICPPLCTWAELNDGTYSLGDVERFHLTMDELKNAYIAAHAR